MKKTSSSLSLTLLLEGHNELPGFDVAGQQDLVREELLHVRGHVQVFALHVRPQRVFDAFKRRTIHFTCRTHTYINTPTPIQFFVLLYGPVLCSFYGSLLFF